MNPYIYPGLDCTEQACNLEMDMIITLVCDRMGITRKEMMIRNRKREILVPRQVAIAFIREFVPHLSLSYIGSIFRLSHCTVVHSSKVVHDTWMTDKVYGYGPVVQEIHSTLKGIRSDIKYMALQNV